MLRERLVGVFQAGANAMLNQKAQPSSVGLHVGAVQVDGQDFPLKPGEREDVIAKTWCGPTQF